jgi:ribosome-associated protein
MAKGKTSGKDSKKVAAHASNSPRGRRSEDSSPQPETTEGLGGAMRALALALEKKGLEPILLDVRQLCSFCNYQLVLSGRSDRQVDAIADAIEAGLKAEGMRPISTESARSGQWALIDYGDFVVHVFLHSAREHYDLEGLWNDAPRIPIDVPAEARIPVDEQYESSAVS